MQVSGLSGVRVGEGAGVCGRLSVYVYTPDLAPEPHLPHTPPMRHPSDYIIIGLLIAFLGVVALFVCGVLIEDAGKVVGMVVAIAFWTLGGVLTQIGMVGVGVKLGLRARDDERAREQAAATYAARAKKSVAKKSA